MIIAALIACQLSAPVKKGPKPPESVPVCIQVTLTRVPATSIANCEMNVLPQLVASQRLGPEWEVRTLCYEEADA